MVKSPQQGEIKRSFDKALLLRATEPLRWMIPKEALEEWWTFPGALMFTNEAGDVGLATCEYPGFYSCHLYFQSKGRKAIQSGKDMLNNLFENYGAKAVRGLIKVDNKAARWASRQMGWESLGIVTFPNGADELFYGTHDHFKDKENS